MATPEPTEPLQARCPRVLLVDDSPDGRRALAKLLEANGFDVVALGTGTEAVAELQQAAAFDIVLADVQLPDLDGREVAAAACQLQPRPYVALVTGWPLESTGQSAEALGVDRVFLKPVRMDDLLAHLSKALGPGAGASG